MKSFESRSESRVTLNPEKALASERGALERFGGKAGKASRALLFISSLVVGAYTDKVAHAQESPATQETTTEIEQSDLTESSTWAQTMLNTMNAEITQLKTAEDADWFLRTHINSFAGEYYLPTQGIIEDGPYGIPTRTYSKSDTRLLLSITQEVQKIVRNVETEFGTDSQRYLAQLEDMAQKLEMDSSYAGQKQDEALHRFEEFLKHR